MKQCVYVMQSDSGLVKIGIAMNPETRRAVIQNGSGFAVSIVKLFGPFNRARHVECAAHALLNDQRQQGEWFECGAQVAIAAVEKAVANFVDEPDGDHSGHSAQVEEMARWAASGLIKPAEDFAEIAQQATVRYEVLCEKFASLTDEFVEACELVEFYADHAKQTTFIAHKAFDQIKRLERQVAELQKRAEASLN